MLSVLTATLSAAFSSFFPGALCGETSRLLLLRFLSILGFSGFCRHRGQKPLCIPHHSEAFQVKCQLGLLDFHVGVHRHGSHGSMHPTSALGLEFPLNIFFQLFTLELFLFALYWWLTILCSLIMSLVYLWDTSCTSRCLVRWYVNAKLDPPPT